MINNKSVLTIHAELNNHCVINPCKKQTVKAIIESRCGKRVIGSNSIKNKIDICPREAAGFKTGEGYHLCKQVCNQNEHAEVDAMNKAEKLGVDLNGAKITITGHTYFCDNCISKMSNRGINSAYCIDSDLLILLQDRI